MGNQQGNVDSSGKGMGVSSVDDASLALPKRIGSLLAELGPRASQNEAVLKAVFTIAKDASSASHPISSPAETLDLNGLLYMLLVVANHETPDSDNGIALRPETIVELS